MAYKCEVCGSKKQDGCNPIEGRIYDASIRNEMTARDWELLYYFYKYVYLPFMHMIVGRVLERRKEDDG